MGPLAQQRQREILHRLGQAGGARVVELAQALDVTEETIRRDLHKLSRDGRLLRTHGGAVALHDERRDLPFEVRRTAHLEEKQAIAARAVRHIQVGDVIALDASSTAHELAKLIPDQAVTVLTNSLPATIMLSARPQVRVICTGGNLDRGSRSFTGSLCEEALDRFHVRRFFFSAKGVDLARGLCEVADDQARFKRRLLDLAERSYLLVDHSKFSLKSVVFFATVADVDTLVTDHGADEETLAQIGRLGVTVEVAR
jgi:DeoR family transcriptional regulator, L-fucose operon activator